MRKINKIIVHCSYTPPSMDIGVEEIRRWHTSPEFGFDDVGYHYVIRRDGTVEKGRDESVVGAHTKGQNADSIGICLVGGMDEDTKKAENNFTFKQWEELYLLLSDLLEGYPWAKVFGHRDFDSGRECPAFDVAGWYASIRKRENDMTTRLNCEGWGWEELPTTDKNTEAVREKLKQRAEQGLQKYGVTTERTDLKTQEWLQHLQDELMDGAVYIQRLMDELE